MSSDWRRWADGIGREKWRYAVKILRQLVVVLRKYRAYTAPRKKNIHTLTHSPTISIAVSSPQTQQGPRLAGSIAQLPHFHAQEPRKTAPQHGGGFGVHVLHMGTKHAGFDLHWRWHLLPCPWHPGGVALCCACTASSAHNASFVIIAIVIVITSRIS